MSRSKKLILLAGLLIALCLCFFLVTKLNSKTEEVEEVAEEQEEIIAFKMDTSEITALSWQCMSHKGNATKEGDNWYFTDENGTKQQALNEKIQPMLTTLSSIPASRCIENPGDLSQFGFEDPHAQVHIDGSSHIDIYFGSCSKVNQELYYFTCGDGKLYLVNGDLSECFYLNNSELLDGE